MCHADKEDLWIICGAGPRLFLKSTSTVAPHNSARRTAVLQKGPSAKNKQHIVELSRVTIVIIICHVRIYIYLQIAVIIDYNAIHSLRKPGCFEGFKSQRHAPRSL